jgi:excisionase family DNA binding protein
MQETQRDAYSTQEFADRLGLGYQTALRMQKNGTVRVVRVGRRVLVPRTELERFLSVNDQAQLR